MFGYLVSGDTRQQKMFLLVGPKRGGKGTIGRVLTRMIGRHNVAGPTLASLGTNFGLQDIIGKPVALVSDARIGGKSDASLIAERLLSISGEDLQNVDRKYLPPVRVSANPLRGAHQRAAAVHRRLWRTGKQVCGVDAAQEFLWKREPELTDELCRSSPVSSTGPWMVSKNFARAGDLYSLVTSC